jgi:curved DNA binding protein
MKHAISLCKPEADIYEVCQQVDAYIEAELQKVYNGKKAKKIDRGISFPCCISVNHIVGHHSPLKDESAVLKAGEIAKIVCGAHIDGFAVNTAHTIVVGDKAAPRAADAIKAAHDCLRAAERLIKSGSTNAEVTEHMNKVAAEYGCNMVEGVLSHQAQKYVIDGNKAIISKEQPLQNVEEWQFEKGEVIHLDVYVSTGEGKTKLCDQRTTVFKRQLQNVYNLKLQKARTFFAEACKRFPSLPFSVRAFEDQIGAKVGVKECIEHELIQDFPVLVEKDGEFVAHFKSTVAIAPSKTIVLGGALAADTSKVANAEHSVKDEALKALIARDLWQSEKAKKK